jgi:very-short-patch-repair endonuclease
MDAAHDTDVTFTATARTSTATTARTSTAEFDRLLLELAGRQHYVVARTQLREFGTARQIEHRLAKPLLEHVHEGVYRIVGSPPTWHQRLRAACLASSGANAVSFRAAAQLWGLPGGEEIVEITAPRHRRMQLPGVRIHESFYLTDRDATYLHGIPVTRPARVICDLALLVARGELRPNTLELALQEALRRGLVDLARVAEEWQRLGGVMRPGGRVLEELLADFIRPVRHTDTSGESQLLQLIRAGGLPEPMPQHRVDISPTKSFKLDFAWPDAKVYCEFDPYKWHGARDKYMRDTKRRLELARAGWSGVPVTDDELDSGARLATELLRRHLVRSG